MTAKDFEKLGRRRNFFFAIPEARQEIELRKLYVAEGVELEGEETC